MIFGKLPDGPSGNEALNSCACECAVKRDSARVGTV